MLECLEISNGSYQSNFEPQQPQRKILRVYGKPITEVVDEDSSSVSFDDTPISQIDIELSAEYQYLWHDAEYLEALLSSDDEATPVGWTLQRANEFNSNLALNQQRIPSQEQRLPQLMR